MDNIWLYLSTKLFLPLMHFHYLFDIKSLPAAQEALYDCRADLTQRKIVDE